MVVIYAVRQRRCCSSRTAAAERAEAVTTRAIACSVLRVCLARQFLRIQGTPAPEENSLASARSWSRAGEGDAAGGRINRRTD